MIKPRDSNIDLLRILCMTSVICMHFLGHGGLLNAYAPSSVSYYLYWLLRIVAYPCVNCFVFISGYYLVNAKINVKKIVLLEVQVFTYSVLGLIVFVTAGNKVSRDVALKSIFPVMSNAYWYATSYCLLLMFSPLLNCVIRSINKKQHLIVIAVLLGVYSVIPTVAYWTRSNLSVGRDIEWFIVLYFISAYFRLYHVKISKKQAMIGWTACVIIKLAEIAFLAAVTQFILGEARGTDLFVLNNSPVILMEAAFEFLFFLQIKVKETSVIQRLLKTSAYSFGAYLLHENVLIRPILWRVISPKRFLNTHMGTWKTIAYMIVSIILIYAMGCLVEYCRKKLMKCTHVEDKILLWLNRGQAIINRYVKE